MVDPVVLLVVHAPKSFPYVTVPIRNAGHASIFQFVAAHPVAGGVPVYI